MTAKPSEQKTYCIACCESIRVGAKVCPHCGSLQASKLWNRIAWLLKWLAGMVTVMSLVIGMITLVHYYQDWRERRNTVNEMVVAAEWLVQSKNYQQAWQMLNQATVLNASAKNIRASRVHLAQLWLRDFQISKDELENKLEQLTETLYRGLNQAPPRQQADIFAHLAYIQVLRKLNFLKVYVDVESLLQQGYQYDADNAYLKTIEARWWLLAKPITEAKINQAIANYQFAVTYNNSHIDRQEQLAFIRKLQLFSLAGLSYGQHDELERLALTGLINASINMMVNQEARPDKFVRNKILDGYGRMGKAEHVEALVTSEQILAQQHLAVYQWLLAADKDSRERMKSQSVYVQARLYEELGQESQALDYYQQLLDLNTRKELDKLVDRGIERLTGQLPARALVRSYKNDVLGKKDPLSFHFETLQHFDPKERYSNIKQALAYFNQIERPSVTGAWQIYDKLYKVSPEVIARVLKVIKQGDKVKAMNAYTTGFSAWHHNNAYQTWYELVLLYTKVLMSYFDIDKVNAQLNDAITRLAVLGDNWQPQQGRLYFQLALSLVKDSRFDDSKSTAVVGYLSKAVQLGAIEAELLSWQDIKQPIFDKLKDNADYQMLIRGR